MSLDEIRSGGKAALARALALLETAPDSDEVGQLLDRAHRRPIAQVVGLTGPPGVGKSTLINALIGTWRAQSRTIGCIAVDPSSKRSKGALLGDRTRFATDPADQGVFVRSMAARDRLGGLASLTHSAAMLMRALFDLVLVETVGVGQSETEVADIADTVIFCVQPHSGDTLQFMKAGIAEIPHIFCVTKGDLPGAARAAADVKAALGLGAGDSAWTVPVLEVSANRRDGIDALVEAVGRHWLFLQEEKRLSRARHAQDQLWLKEAVRERFGRHGLKRAGSLALPFGEPPFGRFMDIIHRLSKGLGD